MENFEKYFSEHGIKKPPTLAVNNPVKLCDGHMIYDFLVKNSVVIGISPRDDVLNKCENHAELNKLIKDTIRNTRGINSIFCVGEWAPHTHRWHYHGIARFEDILALERVKRKLSRFIGRTITEQLKDEEAYEDYMFKVYEEPVVMNTIQPFTESSYFLLVKKPID